MSGTCSLGLLALLALSAGVWGQLNSGKSALCVHFWFTVFARKTMKCLVHCDSCTGHFVVTRLSRFVQVRQKRFSKDSFVSVNFVFNPQEKCSMLMKKRKCDQNHPLYFLGVIEKRKAFRSNQKLFLTSNLFAS